MAYDVFISYSTDDKRIAEIVCVQLESRGISCWMATRDILPGTEWGESIINAIANCRLLLLIFSSTADTSKQVLREVEQATRNDKIIIPFRIENHEPTKSMRFFLSATQWLDAFTHSLEPHIERLVTIIQSLKNKLDGSDLQKQKPLDNVSIILHEPQQLNDSTTDAELVNLGIQICREVSKELQQNVDDEEVGKTISKSESRPGDVVKVIDILCNRIARRLIKAWGERHNCEIMLTGEDLPSMKDPSFQPKIVCCLDSLDGTQHWLRGRNLYGTALSFFRKDQDVVSSYKLRASVVMDANGRIFFADEDSGKAFECGKSTPLQVTSDYSVALLDEAHVCTVARRPNQYRVLAMHLVNGSPFQGLYTFGGNPILAALALGKYDAVFQADASFTGDIQPLWDWLPGGHIAYRANCHIFQLDGSDFDVLGTAENCINNGECNCPYVAALNYELGLAIVEWLKNTQISI
ncbi:TIR domain-containing protein [candidate division KSB1 bacterium]|nr:MAG: TIR domain-containing protein [candidate division KSB1 bacterium]MBC6946572.1 TIR domain-containing protein [candidate division KSB1 bacterium]MCE7942498.1 TIR domain-containing protein [Chlorobi bacterium CHB1]MDL1875807.1 TIR domain-containing protein [Cytophagia bacterium CHB2]